MNNISQFQSDLQLQLIKKHQMSYFINQRSKSLIISLTSKDKKVYRLNTKKKHTQTLDILFQQAKQIYQSQLNFEQAAKLFQNYLLAHPHHDQALYMCAASYLHLNQCQIAIDKFSNISRTYFNKAQALLLTAIAYKRMGNINKSFEIVNECIEKYSDFQEAICMRGKLYLQSKQYKKAKIDFNKIINLRQSSFIGYIGLGDCFRFQSKVQKALKCYNKALDSLQQKSNDGQNQRKWQVHLKIAICYYLQQRLQQSYQLLTQLSKKQQMKISQLFYYIGKCQLKMDQRQQGMMNLQYCLRLQTNKEVMRQAYKKLISNYVQNYQYYQAWNVAKLNHTYDLKLDEWSSIVQGFIMIMKNKLESGRQLLTSVTTQIKEKQKHISKINQEKETKHIPSSIIKTDHDPGIRFTSNSPNHLFKDSLQLHKGERKLKFFSSKSITKPITKFNIHSPKLSKIINLHNSHSSSQIIQNLQKQAFTTKQKQLLYPIILKFTAYAYFFQNNYLLCVQLYQEYQTYLKDVLGKQSDIIYNKYLSEGLLLFDELPQQSINKFRQASSIFNQKHGYIPPQPILYKIALLIKMAIKQLSSAKQSEQSDSQFESNRGDEILFVILQVFEEYRSSIDRHPFAYYYEAVIFFMLQKYEHSLTSIKQCFYLIQEYPWNLFYVKGIIQLKLLNYHDAIKQFTTGMKLQPKPQLFIARSITYLTLGLNITYQLTQQSLIMLLHSVDINANMKGQSLSDNNMKHLQAKDLLIQRCFQDLQMFINLQTNKEYISLWVSRILFATHSYDEAIESLNKITNITEQVNDMIQFLQIYQGQFSQGGTVGLIIKSAFDGTLLSANQYKNILTHNNIKDYSCYNYLTCDYQKWLVTLHLYVKEDYQLLIQYIQKQMLQCKNDQTEVLLRYNLAKIYFLSGQVSKGMKLIATLNKFVQKFKIMNFIHKFQQSQFVQDECLPQLKQQILIQSMKFLSNYLPYRSFSLLNKQNKIIKVHTKISIPLPTFKQVQLQMNLSHQFLLQEINPKRIPKNIEPPWLRKINKTLQFTQKLEQSFIQENQQTDLLSN